MTNKSQVKTKVNSHIKALEALWSKMDWFKADIEEAVGEDKLDVQIEALYQEAFDYVGDAITVSEKLLRELDRGSRRN